jgi:hypothetical protein
MHRFKRPFLCRLSVVELCFATELDALPPSISLVVLVFLIFVTRAALGFNVVDDALGGASRFFGAIVTFKSAHAL